MFTKGPSYVKLCLQSIPRGKFSALEALSGAFFGLEDIIIWANIKERLQDALF